MLLSDSRMSLRTAALAALAASLLATSSSWAAGRKQSAEEPPEDAFSGKAMLAVVSLARQRVSVYDAEGGVLRSSVSSGQTGYETPVGVYSILQKKEEHYSNLYDDASMPFMQRITWSGVALHAGVIPGYPASHGCVRLPSGFAEKLFPTTRVGMRVVVSRDDVAPAPISHPFLFQPGPARIAEAKAPVRAAYWREDEETAALPDVDAWPARLALQQQLQAAAAVKSRAARAAADAAEPAKDLLKEKTADHAKSQRAVKAAETAVKKAKDGVAQADKVAAKMKKPSAVEAAERMKAKAAAALAKAESQLATAGEAAKVTAEALAHATETAKAAQEIEDKAQAEFKDTERRMLPVSVFISLKSQRLYVRQNREAVLDVPVTIRDPERPVGTHVFTALAYGDGGDGVRWNVVSLTSRASADDADQDDDGDRRGKRHQKKDPKVPLTDVAAASETLDRIDIPADVRARLAEYVWPGSSIIVSDEGLSAETGKATEFVVVLSGYPQGALKKRPKPQPDRGFDRYYRDYRGYGYEASASPNYYYQPRYRQYYRPQKPSMFGFW